VRRASTWALFAVVAFAGASRVHAQAWQDDPDALGAPRPSRPSPDAGTPPATTSPPSTTAPAPAPSTAPPPAPGSTAPEAPYATPHGEVPPAPNAVPPPSGYGEQPYSPYPAPRVGPGQRRGHLLDDGGTPIAADVATRLRVIDESLTVLAARGGNNILDGVLTSLFGALSFSLSFVPDTDSEQRLALRLWGSTSIVRGVIEMAVPADRTEPAIRFSNMPMRGEGEVLARLTYGENALERIARRSKIARVLDASVAIASGLAVIPIFLGPNEFDSADPFDYIIIVSSGISVISGIVSLATRSDAERRWSAYQDLRDQVTRDASDGVGDDRGDGLSGSVSITRAAPARRRPEAIAGGGPMPGGGVVTAGVRF
jgi:hypothetical protein